MLGVSRARFVNLIFLLLTVFGTTYAISRNTNDMAFASQLGLRAITEAEAITIATQFVKKKEPLLDISVRPPVAKFFPHGFSINGRESDVWTVNFGIPAPAGYTRSIISHHVWLDRYGRIVGGPNTTSP